MAGRMPASGTNPGKQAVLDTATEEKLPKWVLVSLLLHGGLILVLILTPFWPSSKREPPPSYVVDLVGGERIGGRNLGTKIALEAKVKSRPAEPPLQAKTSPPPPPPKPLKQKEPKAEKLPQIDKTEKVKAKPVEEVAIAKKKPAPIREENKKQVAAREPSKEARDAAKSDDNSLEKVRERLIQSAIERVRSRTAAEQESPSGASNGKGEPLSAGNAEGIGAQSLGKGGVGGEGVLKSVEFIAYQNRLVNTIKGNWAWAGRRSDLKVVVQFGIKDNGEIVGLRVTQRSGDATYDESVIRAIRRSSPFSVPPENYRKEFADIEMTFKPSDFGA